MIRAALHVPLALALAACGGATPSKDTGDDIGDTDESDTGEPPFDLAACELPRDCALLCEHIGVYDCNELEGPAPSCAAKLLVAGTPGVLEHLLLLYGQPEVDTIHVMRGDGTAVLQTRTRDMAELPWENPGVPMLCNVVLPAELGPACEVDDGACQWQRSFYQDCVELPLSDCAEVEAWLGG